MNFINNLFTIVDGMVGLGLLCNFINIKLSSEYKQFMNSSLYEQ